MPQAQNEQTVQNQTHLKTSLIFSCADLLNECLGGSTLLPSAPEMSLSRLPST